MSLEQLGSCDMGAAALPIQPYYKSIISLTGKSSSVLSADLQLFISQSCEIILISLDIYIGTVVCCLLALSPAWTRITQITGNKDAKVH